MEGRDGGQQGRASGMRRGVPWRDVKQEAQLHESPSAARRAHAVAGGLEGKKPGTQQQLGQVRVTQTVCAKALPREVGKHSQHPSTGMMTRASPAMQGTVGGNKLVKTATQITVAGKRCQLASVTAP